MTTTGRHTPFFFGARAVAAVAAWLLCATAAVAGDRVQPYKGYTGTVHQFGFIGGLYYTSNPNAQSASDTHTYHDFGLGAVYNLHDYVTRQFAFELLSSFTVVTAEALQQKELGDKKQKIIWPVDCRFCLGPSEDFQAYIGLGAQWNMLEKTTGPMSITTGQLPSKTIHQLSGNTAVGLNFFGPQKYMFHLNMGAKFHFPVTDNDHTPADASVVDISKDRGCIVLNGGVTLDVDRRKNACLMLNYEYPLGTPKATAPDGSEGGFFSNTQTLSLGLVFHFGGTR